MPEGSVLLIEELFATGEARFLDEILLVRDPKKLAGFAGKWLADPRPWARERLVDYLRRGLDQPGQRYLLKKLFKIAEERGDDPAMAHRAKKGGTVDLDVLHGHLAYVTMVDAAQGAKLKSRLG